MRSGVIYIIPQYCTYQAMRQGKSYSIVRFVFRGEFPAGTGAWHHKSVGTVFFVPSAPRLALGTTAGTRLAQNLSY